MFILFDTNVWFSQLGLQSPIGAAIRHFTRRRNATVAIPEIVQLEVEETLTTHMLKLKKQIEDSHRQLLHVLGKLKPIHLPSEEEIRKAVESIIPKFDVPIQQIPFNVDVARSSMMKTLRKIPPSGEKNEQFRDGVIWAHCLELISEGDVYLVSEDRDFYQGKNYQNGLASELAEEMRHRSKTRWHAARRGRPETASRRRGPGSAGGHARRCGWSLRAGPAPLQTPRRRCAAPCYSPRCERRSKTALASRRAASIRARDRPGRWSTRPAPARIRRRRGTRRGPLSTRA